MSAVSVFKIGGKVIDREESLDVFLRDMIRLEGAKILVHGGGAIATRIGNKMGIEAEMKEGRRITDEKTLEVITMVYGGLVNRKIVAKCQSLGVDAIGLTGADLNVIEAERRQPDPVDFGWVGDIKKVNLDKVVGLLEMQVLPVLAPLTHDGKGHLLNTNADTIAAYMAAALAKEFEVDLNYCFEQPGVMLNGELIPRIDRDYYDNLKEKKVISAGMIPKMDLGFYALKKGCNVVIKNAQNLKDKEAGTVLI